MLKFNVNNYVRIRLTDKGRELIKDYAPARYRVEDGNGWSEWQMWELMYVLGKHMYNGCDIPFETEILILDGTLV